MLKIALTGGIATGKSYVVAELRRRGIACLDADALAHGVTAAGTEATAAIADRFGRDVLDASGAVDRRKLGAMVFADTGARRDLEAIVHPAVYRAITAGFRAFEMLGDTALVVADIPLLYETGREKEFDRVIATVCSRATQLDRLRQRGLNYAEAVLRLAAQISAADKASRADYVIDTDGSFDDTKRTIDGLLEALHKAQPK
jgi:dephospho-CoA kinase